MNSIRILSQSTYLLFMVLFLCSLLVTTNSQAQGQLPVTYHPATDVNADWRLGVQVYSFNRFTFYEALDKTASLGLDWVEAYPGQKLSADKPDVVFDHKMPTELRLQVKKKLAELGLKLVNYGVVELPNDEAKCRVVFDFAKDMGIETIVSEPVQEAMPMVDKLCQEYKIYMAIHNHPKPSRYWDPDKVVQACKGRSKYIGSCSDTGHWMRSGVNPLEALKKLQGRIISLHIKDLSESNNPKAHDVIWGTGKADFNALLAELNRQKFKGVFSIEYEYNWDNSVPDIRACVASFDLIAGKYKPSGWMELFAGDFTNASLKQNSWTWENGELTWHGGDYIWTKEKYGDFILNLEYKVSAGANSGVFFRTGEIENYVHTGIEVQVHESTDGTKYGMVGAIYDCLPAKKNVAKKAGEWNHFTITCLANKIYVVQNGEQIIDMDLNLWTKAHKNPDGTDNKFNIAYKDMPRSGYIGLQDHGQPVWFRNLKIKKL